MKWDNRKETRGCTAWYRKSDRKELTDYADPTDPECGGDHFEPKTPIIEFDQFKAKVRVNNKNKVFVQFDSGGEKTTELFLGSSKTDYTPTKASSYVKAALESINVDVKRGEPNRIIMAIKKRLQDEDFQEQLIKAETRQTKTESEPSEERCSRICIDDVSEIESGDGGVYLVKEQVGNGGETYETKIKVFTPLTVEQELSVDGMTIYQIKTSRKTYRGVATELLDYLRHEGVILARSKSQDVLNCLLQFSGCEKKQGHGAIGVYRNNNHPHLVVDPFCITTDQNTVVDRTREAEKEELTSEKVQKFLELIGYWHPYEIYPVMGLSVIAPFSLIFRSKVWIVPYLFHVSPESGIGKTATGRCFSEYLFGPKEVQADSYASPFRFCTLFDQGCLPQVVSEAERFPWGKMYPMLQSGAESEILDIRGLPNLDTRRYLSRAVLFFSGNALGITRKALLIRFIVVEYDRDAKNKRIEKKTELNQIIKQLRPIGFRIIEEAINHYPTIEAVFDEVEKLEYQISELYNFQDPRRSRIWALVYWGLKIWEHTAQKVGLEWEAPVVDDFVRSVVAPNEYRIFESVEAQHDSFLSFFYSWMNKNTYIENVDGERVERVKGDGDLYKLGEVNELEGAWITKSLLDEYRSDSRGQRVPIESLSDLAKAVGSKFGFNPDDIHMSQRFGVSGKVKKAVFVPFDNYDESNGQDQEKSGNSVEKRGDTLHGYKVTGDKDEGKNSSFNQRKQEDRDSLLPSFSYIEVAKVTGTGSHPSLLPTVPFCNQLKVTKNKGLNSSNNQSKDSEEIFKYCNQVTRKNISLYSHQIFNFSEAEDMKNNDSSRKDGSISTNGAYPVKHEVTELVKKCDRCGVESGALAKITYNDGTITYEHLTCLFKAYPEYKEKFRGL